MQRRSWAARRESGASTLEYAAALAIAAIVIVAVAFAARTSAMPSFIIESVCKVSAAVGVGSCADGPGNGGVPGNTDPADVDIPDDLDPDSALVQMMLSTERGRQTLQWLADNDIPIVIDPGETGAYWNGTEIVLGEGYADAAVLIHEANHARYTVEGRSAEADEMGRDEYITAAIDEEVDGLVQQILAAQELRAYGYELGPQPAETQFQQAYTDALQNGATTQEAMQAGTDAVNAEFYNGGIVTSTNNQSYPDSYGEYWDDVN